MSTRDFRTGTVGWRAGWGRNRGHAYSIGQDTLLGGREGEDPWGHGEHPGDTCQPSSLPDVLYPPRPY